MRLDNEILPRSSDGDLVVGKLLSNSSRRFHRYEKVFLDEIKNIVERFTHSGDVPVYNLISDFKPAFRWSKLTNIRHKISEQFKRDVKSSRLSIVKKIKVYDLFEREAFETNMDLCNFIESIIQQSKGEIENQSIVKNLINYQF
jgi:hypothetical protein